MSILKRVIAGDTENNSNLYEQYLAAYVLLRSSQPKQAIQHLWSLDGVRLAHLLEGPENLICYLETCSIPEFRSVLDRGVRHLVDTDIVERTETIMVLAERGVGYAGSEGQHVDSAAWLFCDISEAEPDRIAARMRMIPGILNAHPVIGRFDIIAYAEAQEVGELPSIMEQLSMIPELIRADARMVAAASLLVA